MKYIALFIVSLSTLLANAQTKLVPAKNVVDKKWLTNRQYQMIWYALRDTAKFEIGMITTTVNNANDKITVITNVSVKKGSTPWIDSTVASVNDMRPIYHSSYNTRRDMVLNFGKIVTGYYNDKMKKTATSISDTTKEEYFDSNLYPSLITWLPLKEGYKQDIAIYDYNPAGKIGVINASVQDVKKGTYQSPVSGDHNVWVVTVVDDIVGEGKTTYYIDVADRKLWKQEIETAGRKMLLQLVEN